MQAKITLVEEFLTRKQCDVKLTIVSYSIEESPKLHLQIGYINAKTDRDKDIVIGYNFDDIEISNHIIFALE